MIEKIVSGAGFEDKVFQSELSSTGSLAGFLSGSHYNHSLVIHNAITQPIERFLLLRFFGETKIQLPESLVKISADPQLFSPNIQDEITEFQRSFGLFKQKIWDGKLEKMPSFSYYIWTWCVINIWFPRKRMFICGTRKQLWFEISSFEKFVATVILHIINLIMQDMVHTMSRYWQTSRLCIQVWNSSSRRHSYHASTRKVSIPSIYWSERRTNNKQRCKDYR